MILSGGGMALIMKVGTTNEAVMAKVMAAVMAVGKPFSPAVATGYASQLTQ